MCDRSRHECLPGQMKDDVRFRFCDTTCDTLGICNIQMQVVSVRADRTGSRKDFVAAVNQDVDQVAAGKAVSPGYECAHLDRHGVEKPVDVGFYHHLDKLF